MHDHHDHHHQYVHEHHHHNQQHHHHQKVHEHHHHSVENHHHHKQVDHHHKTQHEHHDYQKTQEHVHHPPSHQEEHQQGHDVPYDLSHDHRHHRSGRLIIDDEKEEADDENNEKPTSSERNVHFNFPRLSLKKYSSASKHYKKNYNAQSYDEHNDNDNYDGNIHSEHKYDDDDDGYDNHYHDSDDYDKHYDTGNYRHAKRVRSPTHSRLQSDYHRSYDVPYDFSNDYGHQNTSDHHRHKEEGQEKRDRTEREGKSISSDKKAAPKIPVIPQTEEETLPFNMDDYIITELEIKRSPPRTSGLSQLFLRKDQLTETEPSTYNAQDDAEEEEEEGKGKIYVKTGYFTLPAARQSFENQYLIPEPAEQVGEGARDEVYRVRVKPRTAREQGELVVEDFPVF